MISDIFCFTDTASKEQEKSIQPQMEEKDDSAAPEDVEMETQEDECLEPVSVEQLKPELPKSRESMAQGKCPQKY